MFSDDRSINTKNLSYLCLICPNRLSRIVSFQLQRSIWSLINKYISKRTTRYITRRCFHTKKREVKLLHRKQRAPKNLRRTTEYLQNKKNVQSTSREKGEFSNSQVKAEVLSTGHQTSRFPYAPCLPPRQTAHPIFQRRDVPVHRHIPVDHHLNLSKLFLCSGYVSWLDQIVQEASTAIYLPHPAPYKIRTPKSPWQ